MSLPVVYIHIPGRCLVLGRPCTCCFVRSCNVNVWKKWHLRYPCTKPLRYSLLAARRMAPYAPQVFGFANGTHHTAKSACCLISPLCLSLPPTPKAPFPHIVDNTTSRRGRAHKPRGQLRNLVGAAPQPPNRWARSLRPRLPTNDINSAHHGAWQRHRETFHTKSLKQESRGNKNPAHHRHKYPLETNAKIFCHHAHNTPFQSSHTTHAGSQATVCTLLYIHASTNQKKSSSMPAQNARKLARS